MIAKLAKKSKNQKELIADLLSPGDIVVLVMPIDSSAPKVPESIEVISLFQYLHIDDDVYNLH